MKCVSIRVGTHTAVPPERGHLHEKCGSQRAVFLTAHLPNISSVLSPRGAAEILWRGRAALLILTSEGRCSVKRSDLALCPQPGRRQHTHRHTANLHKWRQIVAALLTKEATTPPQLG